MIEKRCHVMACHPKNVLDVEISMCHCNPEWSGSDALTVPLCTIGQGGVVQFQSLSGMHALV